jgi:ribulose-5-phosphate 4-epimerase/fuculose-1-phosphate aldolase
LLKTISDHRAVLMRGHGIVVAGKSLAEVLFASLILEDDAKKTMQAASLGAVQHFTADECKTFNAEIDFERRANRSWEYFSRVESQWDKQGGTGRIELFP